MTSRAWAVERHAEHDAHVVEQVIARSSGASYAIGAAARFRELDNLARPRDTLAKDLRNYLELSSKIRTGHRFGEFGDAVLDRLDALDGFDLATDDVPYNPSSTLRCPAELYLTR